MEQVAEGSCESLSLVEQSKERKGRLARAAWDMLGQGLWERCTGRAAAGQDRSSQLGGITPEHTACCEQLWEASQEEGLLEKQSFLLLTMGLNSQHGAFIFCDD